MEFEKAVKLISTSIELKRISSAYVIDYRNLNKEEIEKALIKTAPQYYHRENIESALQGFMLSEDRNERIIAPIMIKLILDKSDFTETQKVVSEEIIKYEQEIVNKSNEEMLIKSDEKKKNLEFFQYVLEAAWEDSNISPDEKNLLEKIRKKLFINTTEYQIIEAKLGKFPKPNNEIHSKNEIENVRKRLQSQGILFSIRDSNNNDYDVIPSEIANVLRDIFSIEIKSYGYKELLTHKHVRDKKYLVNILTKANVDSSMSMKLLELQNLCIDYIRPSELLGGFSPRDGLDVSVLYDWCHSLKLPVSGQKSELISRIIQYYDEIQKIVVETDDPREKLFEVYTDLANRDLSHLRKQGILEKDIECERKFEEATNYIFEKILKHKPLLLKGTEHPDGILSFQDKFIIWDNKSKESDVKLSDHIKQFNRYITNSDKPVASFLVIGPSFTEDSVAECMQYSLTSDTLILLITAKELKNIAFKWKQKHKDDEESFPLGYFKQVGRFNENLVKI